MSARFSEEGFQERYVAEVKKLTGKPVVGVGRFTSPDMMVSQIRRGVLDFIGAARPSIADPWLPRKIAEGREDEIRECIGCNICRAHNNMGVPIRCTQNPTMGEEYRRGWHPERVPAAKGHAEDSVLVVGGGPAGLECAMTLGKRGYRVMLAEARRELGGRVALESRLPGLSSWGRVRDYRAGPDRPARQCRGVSREPALRRRYRRHGLPPCDPGDGRRVAARRHRLCQSEAGRSMPRHPGSSPPTMCWPGACPTVMS